MLLCAHRELFPPALGIGGQGVEETCLQMPTHDSPIDVCVRARACLCVCVCARKRPDGLMRGPAVLNNDTQQLRMSMSFPVFVRSYSLLL